MLVSIPRGERGRGQNQCAANSCVELFCRSALTEPVSLRRTSRPRGQPQWSVEVGAIHIKSGRRYAPTLTSILGP